MPPGDDGVEHGIRAVAMIEHGRHESHTKFVGPRRRRKGRRRYRPELGLLATLYETRGFKCKDDRDKIYSLLSMVTDVGPKDVEVQPNYKASVSKVFEAVARWDVEKNQSLEILSYCSGLQTRQLDLPSWVPDFANLEGTSPVARFLKGKLPHGINRGFVEYYKHQPTFSVDDDGQSVIHLSAEVVDTIRHVGRVFEMPRIIIYGRPLEEKGPWTVAMDRVAASSRRAWLHECIKIALSADPASPKAKLPTDPWKSTTLGLSPEHYTRFQAILTPFSSRHRGVAPFAQFLQIAGAGTDSTGEKWHSRWVGANADDGPHDVDHALRRFARGRRFCATRTGELGWVPAGAAEGDLVCLVSGARAPIILRKLMRRTGEEKYHLIGDAFVTGLMNSTEPGMSQSSAWERLAVI